MNQDVLQRVLKASFVQYGIDVAAAGATREDLDSLLVARLMDLSEGQDSSFAYLLGCYDNARQSHATFRFVKLTHTNAKRLWQLYRSCVYLMLACCFGTSSHRSPTHTGAT